MLKCFHYLENAKLISIEVLSIPIFTPHNFVIIQSAIFILLGHK